MHAFFNSSVQSVSPPGHPMNISAYGVDVNANAVTSGFLAETNEKGVIVAVKYPNGTTLRRHADFVVTITNTAAWFCDRWGGVHPLD